MYVVFPVSQREFLRLAEEGRGAKKQSATDFNVSIQFSNGATYGEKGQIDFVDRPHVCGPHGQARVLGQMVAEPLRIENGDAVRRPFEYRLRELGADVSAAAGDK